VTFYAFVVVKVPEVGYCCTVEVLPFSLVVGWLCAHMQMGMRRSYANAGFLVALIIGVLLTVELCAMAASRSPLSASPPVPQDSG